MDSSDASLLNTLLSIKRKYFIYGAIFLLIFLPMIYLNSSTPMIYSQQITITKKLLQSTSSRTTITSTSIRTTRNRTLATSITINMTKTTTTTMTTTTDMSELCDNVSESDNINISQSPCEQIRCAVILRHSGGRLGNRMFMFASAYGLARTQNCRLHVSESILAELSENFRMKPIDEKMWLSKEQYSKLDGIESKDTACTFMYQLLRPNAFRYLELTGYWQSYLHFDAYREEIREIFTGRPSTLVRVADYLTSITNHTCPLCAPLPDKTHQELRQAFQTRYNITWIGIHIRRVDFRSIGYASDATYVFRAMKYFRRRFHYQRVRFLIASDDKTYCHIMFRNETRSNKVFILSHDFLQSDDLIALSLCHHSIVTGGTYGFWSAYLAGGEVIHDIKYQAVCARSDYYPPWFVLVGPTIEKKS